MYGHFDYSGERVRDLKKKHDASNNRKEYAAALEELLALMYALAVGACEMRGEMHREAKRLAQEAQ